MVRYVNAHHYMDATHASSLYGKNREFLAKDSDHPWTIKMGVVHSFAIEFPPLVLSDLYR